LARASVTILGPAPASFAEFDGQTKLKCKNRPLAAGFLLSACFTKNQPWPKVHAAFMLVRDAVRTDSITEAEVMTTLLAFRNPRVPGIAAVMLVVSLCSASVPSQAQFGPREAEGTAAGSLLGGVIGGIAGGRGSGAVAGAIAGAAIGGFIGNRIGAALDEQDRLAMARTTRAAVTSGKSKSFSSKSGVRGRAQVVSSQRVDGRECRTIRQEVVLKDGSSLNDTVRACKGPKGWEV
jgi:surface antigen